MTTAQVPQYWMYETSGVLARVVRAYLEGKTLTPADIRVMRAYLMLWIASPLWRGEDIAALRADAAAIQSQRDVTQWLARAMRSDIDPL